jgi:hypothetical protein
MPEMPDHAEGMNQEDLRNQPHLEIYGNYSILAGVNNAIERIWAEGRQGNEAQERYRQVKSALNQGFFEQKIEEAKSPETASVIESRISADQRKAIQEIVSSITAQTGRALVDIFVLQLTVKTICPEQDIRLHKGSSNRGTFSWREGISMRSIDAEHIIPTLRKYELLRINQYGGYMTRTFAENYPYTKFYKAEIRAKQQARQRWLQVIDDLEKGGIDADAALLYVLQLLWQFSEAFSNLVQKTLNSLGTWIDKNEPLSISSTVMLIKEHIEESEARARLLEVAMHALLQTLGELGVDLGGKLKPLMPMRTANKKHGNIGDVEVLSGNLLIEAWDAKYEQPYLSDALDELVEKIHEHNIDVSELQFGYVLFPAKKTYPEVDHKVDDIDDQLGLKVQILAFDEWVHEQFIRSQNAGISEENLARTWLQVYTESLCLKRVDQAPIDEPTFDWVESLMNRLS